MPREAARVNSGCAASSASGDFSGKFKRWASPAVSCAEVWDRTMRSLNASTSVGELQCTWRHSGKRFDLAILPVSGQPDAAMSSNTGFANAIREFYGRLFQYNWCECSP